jgi:PPOX class probable F420-dependent enzyme
MTEEEWRRFLRAPVRPAMLATTRKDGRPHVAPVWYDVDDDGTLVLTTGRATVKGQALRRDPRVAVCVQDDRPPFAYVMVEGTAEVSDDPPGVRRWATRIGGRYMGPDQAEAFGTRNAVPGEMVVRITPAHVVALKDLAL